MAEVARGHVTDRPFARTIYAIALKRFSGKLVLTEGGRHYQLGWQDGFVIAAESASPMDSTSRVALTAGFVNSTQLGSALRQASMQQGRSQLELIGEAAGLSPSHLERIEVLAYEAAATRVFALEKASFVLDDRFDLLERGRIDPRWLVYHGVQRHYREARLASETAALGDRPFRLTDQGRKNVPRFGFDESALQVIRALERGPVTIASLVGALGLATRQAQAIAYALAVTDSVVPADSPAPKPPPKPAWPRPNPARAAEIQTSRKASVAVSSVRNVARSDDAARSRAARKVTELIETKLAALDAGADHFSLLGVQAAAPPEAVRASYFQLARQLHPDRLRALGLTDSDKDAHRLFARVNEAFAVLSDPARRRRYLEVQEQGGEKAVRAKQRAAEEMAMKILAAEREFKRGSVALQHGNIAAARAAFARAVELNPDEAEHHALYGWALWCDTQDKSKVLEEATGRFARALSLQPKCVPAFFYRGQIAKQRGNLTSARESFQRVLELEPGHKDAQLELRLLAKRDEGKKSGLFDRFKRR